MALHKTKEVVKKLPTIKPHLDFIAALLTIPVLLTVMVLNFATLSKNQKATVTPTPSPMQNINAVEKPVTVVQVRSAATPTPQISQAACKPGIGTVTIASPNEGDIVTSNPLCIAISEQDQGYCSVVWAYKINNGPLSDYSNNTICLYNMPSGPVNVELHVKSIVSSQTQILTRTFTYQSPNTTPTPTISLTPTPTGAK